MVTDKEDIQNISQILQERLAYEFRPNGGDERRLFSRRTERDQLYHLHLSDNDNPNFKQSIALREFLRTHPKDARRYDDIKKQASELAMKSKDYEVQKITYQNAKADFIRELNKKALRDLV